MKTIGERIVKVRWENQYTQTKLAKSIGVTNNTMSKIERDLIPWPSSKHIYNIAKLFGVSADYLLGLDEDEMDDQSKIKSQRDEPPP